MKNSHVIFPVAVDAPLRNAANLFNSNKLQSVVCGRSVDAVPRHGTMVEEGEAVEGEVEITTMRVASAASLATGRELLRDSRVLNSDGRGAPQPPDGPLRTSSCSLGERGPVSSDISQWQIEGLIQTASARWLKENVAGLGSSSLDYDDQRAVEVLDDYDSSSDQSDSGGVTTSTDDHRWDVFIDIDFSFLLPH